MEKEITKEEILNVLAELLLREDIRIEVSMTESGEAEKLIIETKKAIRREDPFEKECVNMLRKFNVPNHLKGYNFLITALKLVNEDLTFLEQITKLLYPKVAEIHKTTSGKVEHGIRHAIAKSYEKDVKVFKENFSYKMRKPTNSEFIATILDMIKYLE